MAYHPRIETDQYGSYTTSRTINSRLWFANNKAFEHKVLSYLAKWVTVRQVKLYAVAIQGNHIHILADFPNKNRADFERDFKSQIGTIAPKYCVDFEGGPFFARRYSQELVPHHVNDMTRQFFYTILQPVKDGLVQKLSDYHQYNCFHDAAWGRVKKYTVVNWTLYNKAKKRKPETKISDFETTYTLKFDRLPGFEHLSQKDYAMHLSEKLEEERQKFIKQRLKEGKGFAGPELIQQTKTGSRPKHTKTSTRYSFRPRVLSCCPMRRKAALDFYFSCYRGFKTSSRRLREGHLNEVFPDGMYRPPFKPPPTTYVI